MNGELEVVKTETVFFPMKPHEREVSEVKSKKIEATIATKTGTIKTVKRFARLKKSLRKCSRSIL